MITPIRGFRAGTGSCSLDPRPEGAKGSPTSGDIRIESAPEETEVRYFFKGGSSFQGVMKGVPARRTLAVVAAPSVRARFNVFVPVLPGRITTVKLRLPGSAAGKACVQGAVGRVRG